MLVVRMCAALSTEMTADVFLQVWIVNTKWSAAGRIAANCAPQPHVCLPGKKPTQPKRLCASEPAYVSYMLPVVTWASQNTKALQALACIPGHKLPVVVWVSQCTCKVGHGSWRGCRQQHLERPAAGSIRCNAELMTCCFAQGVPRQQLALLIALQR